VSAGHEREGGGAGALLEVGDEGVVGGGDHHPAAGGVDGEGEAAGGGDGLGEDEVAAAAEVLVEGGALEAAGGGEGGFDGAGVGVGVGLLEGDAPVAGGGGGAAEAGEEMVGEVGAAQLVGFLGVLVGAGGGDDDAALEVRHVDAEERTGG